MPKLVVTGAMMSCPGAFGGAPGTFAATKTTVTAGKMDAGNTSMVAPSNVPSFGSCIAPGNAAAQAAMAAGTASGVPCVPAPAGTWMPGATKVTIAKMAALHDGCKLTCSVGAVPISFTAPGQAIVDVT